MLMPLTVRQHVETTVDGARVMQATKVHGARSTSAYHTGGSWTILAFVKKVLLATDVSLRQALSAYLLVSLRMAPVYVPMTFSVSGVRHTPAHCMDS